MGLIGHQMAVQNNGRLILGAPIARNTENGPWPGSILQVQGEGSQASLLIARPVREIPPKGIRADWTGASLAENNGLVIYGSPRSYLYKGSATWCKDCFTPGEKIGELLGDSFGARYGQSVCLVDFNGDGVKDVVVGSPLHSPSIVSTFNPFMLDNFRCIITPFYLRPSDHTQKTQKHHHYNQITIQPNWN